MTFYVKLIGMVLGVVFRTFMPYIRKMRTMKKFKFRKKYLVTCLFSIGVSIVATILIYPEFNISKVTVQTLPEQFKLFCLAFGFGFGTNSGLNELTEWGKHKER